MSAAKKCDLCGALYEYYSKSELKKGEVFNGIEFAWIDSSGEAYHAFDVHYKNKCRLDLCLECRDHLIKLMDTIRKESGI